MNCLAVNTAGQVTEAALITDKEFSVKRIRDKRMTSEALLPVIDELIKSKGFKLADTDVFGVCVGPGSFTGIRIGVVTVKAFCYALGRECAVVNLNRALAYNNLGEKGAVSLVDAGSGLCCRAVYNAAGEELITPSLINISDIKDETGAFPGFIIHADKGISGITGYPESEGNGFVYAIKAELSAGRLISGGKIEPLYVRKPQAEIDYENKQRGKQ